MSPAENLAETTTGILFFHLVPERAGLVGVATLECFIGACFLAGKWMRLAIWLLAAEFVGILSPIVLLPGRLFAGPHHAPTLEGQYVLKTSSSWRPASSSPRRRSAAGVSSATSRSPTWP